MPKTTNRRPQAHTACIGERRVIAGTALPRVDVMVHRRSRTHNRSPSSNGPVLRWMTWPMGASARPHSMAHARPRRDLVSARDPDVPTCELVAFETSNSRSQTPRFQLGMPAATQCVFEMLDPDGGTRMNGFSANTASATSCHLCARVNSFQAATPLLGGGAACAADTEN